MDTRARIRALLRRAGTSAAVAALLVPAAAGTASAGQHKRRAALPVITSVKPMKARIGDTLIIRGRNFRRGVDRNTVIFMRDGGRPVFVKAGKGTAKLLVVKLPETLAGGLQVKSGVPVATRFRLRVLAGRFGKAFTGRGLSPLIGPVRAAGSAPATPPAAAPDADCDGDGQVNRLDADDDNDLLADGVETALKLDPCKADTDGDKVPDGYEYRSARDLNDDDYQAVPNAYQPYPGKKPYPNPLDPSDADVDYDGDSLTLSEEYALWQYTTSREGAPYDLERLTYSDGEQYSLSVRDAGGRRPPSMPVAAYDKHQQFMTWLSVNGYRTVTLKVRSRTAWNDGSTPVEEDFGIFDVNLVGGETPAEVADTSDLDGDGFISDDERDEDADGLSNYDEAHGRMLPEFWKTCYTEVPYVIAYAATRLDDADTDGDGILDGADDQDHDDIPNVMELSRLSASGVFDGKRPCVPPDEPPGTPTPFTRHPNLYGQVNPFNPCLPATWSRTCQRHYDINGASAPFDLSPNWYSLN